MESSTSKTIKDRVEQALQNDNVSDLERIDHRRCSSDDHNGVELDIYGGWLNTRSVIDVLTETDGAAIESLSHCSEGEPHLCVFVAELPEQEHPAFV